MVETSLQRDLFHNRLNSGGSGKSVYKCGRTRSFLTGFHFGGIELKDRSAGGWRSGLQRSEK
jgi:hypothetical protein